MNDEISQTEIEQLSEQDLRSKFYELFNALSRKQQVIQEYAEIKDTLHRIQLELHKRQTKPRL